MKNDDVPENFHSPYMEKVRERLAILKMTIEERNRYFAYKKQVFTDRDIMSTARQEGLEEGLQKGKVEGKIEVAQKMLSKGADINVIAEFTGLSEEEVRKLEGFS
jgi:predicted transposase/invertase (TIGR01784 family)